MLWCVSLKWFVPLPPWVIGLFLVCVLLPSCQSCLNSTPPSRMFPVCHFTQLSILPYASLLPGPPHWKSPNPHCPIGPCDLLSSPCFLYWFAKCELHLPLLQCFLLLVKDLYPPLELPQFKNACTQFFGVFSPWTLHCNRVLWNPHWRSSPHPCLHCAPDKSSAMEHLL